MKVVTQSPPSLKLVPLKFGMSSEAEEMSSKPSLQNRCQTQRKGPEGQSTRQKQYIWRKAVGEEKLRGLGSRPPDTGMLWDPEQVLVPL